MLSAVQAAVSKLETSAAKSEKESKDSKEGEAAEAYVNPWGQSDTMGSIVERGLKVRP